MSRSREGHINAGRIETSFKRLLPILEILKRTPHPLSAQDIAKHAYSGSDDVMLNVSTNIGEMRSAENRELGYIVSEAHRWMIKESANQEYQKPKQGRFIMSPERALPWHDGRPRYWLIAAPGWEPLWTISEEGSLIMRGYNVPTNIVKKTFVDEAMPQGLCKNPACRRSLDDILGPPYCPNEMCKRGYFASLQVKMF